MEKKSTHYAAPNVGQSNAKLRTCNTKNAQQLTAKVSQVYHVWGREHKSFIPLLYVPVHSPTFSSTQFLY